MTTSRTTMRRISLLAVGALLLTACGARDSAAPPTTRVDAAPAAQLSDVAPPQDCGDGHLAIESLAPLPGSTLTDTLNAGGLQAIKDRGRLIVGTSADVLLWGARDPKTGRLQGFDVLMAQEIARAILGDPNKIEYRVINYAQRLPAVSGGKAQAEGQKDGPVVDVVLHTMTINCDRWKQIAFSSEYYHAGQKLLVRADDPSFVAKKANMEIGDLAKGTKICVPAGSTNEELLKKEYSQFTAVPVPEIGECLVMFQRGEVSAVTGDDTVLAGFAAQDPYAQVVGPALSDEPYGIGINKDNADLVRAVNAILEQTRRNGRWKAIYQQTMGQAIPKVPAIPQAQYGR